MAIETVGKDFKDLVQVNEEGDLQYDTDIMADEIKSPGNDHQPVIAVFDNSISMSGDAGNGKTKSEIVVEQYNDIPNSEAVKGLNAVERNAVDMIALSFGGDGVKVLAPWMPMSVNEGIEKLNPTGLTPGYEALVNGIEASRVIRHRYAKEGVGCRRPQITMFTDGMWNDGNKTVTVTIDGEEKTMTQKEYAKHMCTKYASIDAGKVKIFIILIPGAMTQEQIDYVTAECQSLCDNITVVLATDCVNGLPAAFQLLTASAVVGVSSTIGEEMKVKYDPEHLKVAGGTKVSNGVMEIGPQITWQ